MSRIQTHTQNVSNYHTLRGRLSRSASLHPLRPLARISIALILAFTAFTAQSAAAPSPAEASTWSGCEYWTGECRFPEWTPPPSPGAIEQHWRTAGGRTGAIGDSVPLYDIAGIYFHDTGTGQNLATAEYPGNTIGDIFVRDTDISVCYVNQTTSELEYLGSGTCHITATNQEVGDAPAPPPLTYNIIVKPRFHVEMEVLSPSGEPREQAPDSLDDLARIGDEVVVSTFTDDPDGATTCGTIQLIAGYTYYKSQFPTGESASAGNFMLTTISSTQTTLSQPNTGCVFRYIVPEPSVPYLDNVVEEFGSQYLSRYGILRGVVKLPGFALAREEGFSTTTWQFNATGEGREFEGTLCSEEGLESCLELTSANPGDYTDDYLPFEYNAPWHIAPPTTEDCSLAQSGGYLGLYFSPGYEMNLAREHVGCAPIELRVPAPAPSFMDDCKSFQCSAWFNFTMSVESLGSVLLAGSDNQSGIEYVPNPSDDIFTVGAGWAGIYPTQIEEATSTYPGTWTPSFQISGAEASSCELLLDGESEPFVGLVTGTTCAFSIDGFPPSPDAPWPTEHPYTVTVLIDGWDQPEMSFASSVFVLAEPGDPKVFSSSASGGVTSLTAEGDGSIAMLSIEDVTGAGASAMDAAGAEGYSRERIAACYSADAQVVTGSEGDRAAATASCLLPDGTYSFTARQVDARGTVTETDATITLRKSQPNQVGSSTFAIDITGALEVGKEATIRSAAWIGRPLPQVGFQWYRCGSPGAATSTRPLSCRAIKGATQISYVVTSVDGNSYLRRAEIARSQAGVRTVYSETSNKIPRSVAPRHVELRRSPSVSGPTIVGRTIRSLTGRWSRTVISSSTYWYRCESAVRSAPMGTPDSCEPIGFGDSHLLTASDKGYYLIARVRVVTGAGVGIAYSAGSGVIR